LKSLALISQSIALDKRFLKVSPWSFSHKLNFIFKKYISIAQNLTHEFKLGESKVKFDGQELFYDSPLGLAGYQSMLSRHQYMLQIANIQNENFECIIDCGANIGFFTLMVEGVYPKAKIHSIEPIPKTYECLSKNTKSLKNVTIHNIAISDSNGTVNMNFEAANSVVSHIDNKGNISVNALTLDSFCLENRIKHIED